MTVQPSTAELFERVKQALMRQFGENGARKAFVGLGEKGGKLTKQIFCDCVDKVSLQAGCQAN